MPRNPLLAGLRQALEAIRAPRFFETERGFQGELVAELSKRLKLPDPAIIEQEHQKRQHAHGLRIRPDIIIHEPFEAGRHANRSEGNILVLELKLNATEQEAMRDFQSLASMLNVLGYPVGVFINIGSTETYAHLVPPKLKGRIVLFAVSLVDGQVLVVEHR